MCAADEVCALGMDWTAVPATLECGRLAFQAALLREDYLVKDQCALAWQKQQAQSDKRQNSHD